MEGEWSQSADLGKVEEDTQVCSNLLNRQLAYACKWPVVAKAAVTNLLQNCGNPNGPCVLSDGSCSCERCSLGDTNPCDLLPGPY